MGNGQDGTRRALLKALALGAVGAGIAPAHAARRRAASPSPVADPTRVMGAPGGTAAGRAAGVADGITETGVASLGWSPLERFVGTITPTDLAFQRHHAGVPSIDASSWALLVHGGVKRPLRFSYADLQRFPMVTRVHFLECAGNGEAGIARGRPKMRVQKVEGLVSNMEWTGVLLRDVLAEAGIDAAARWVVAEGGDASRLARSVPLAKALDDVMIVYGANGEPLRPASGYPVRLLVPGWQGNMSVKWLRRLELTTEPLQSAWETAVYAQDLPDGTLRQFTFVMDAKSTITQPTFPTKLTGPGWWPITGLAWSGRGRIAHVDVSTDGGATWARAELCNDPAPKAMVRFRHLWQWDGAESVLMSRATDETGYVQPSWQEFVAARGAGARYHVNPIRAWRVGSDGAVTYVPPEDA